MNIFRLTGDWLHVLATIILFVNLIKKKSAKGISGKTQLLYALTYTARYLDVFTNFVSYYNTLLKIYYLIISYLFVYLIYRHYKESNGQEQDNFWVSLLFVPVTVLSLTVNHEMSVLEVLWTWSIYMEAVALIPQLYLIWKTKDTKPFIILYLFCMALYRGYYIANWGYRYMNESYYDSIAIYAGVVETFVGFIGVLTVLNIFLMNRRDISPASGSTEKSVYNINLLQNAEKFQPEFASKGKKAIADTHKYLPA